MACPLMFASCHGVRGPLRTALERPALTEGTVPEFRRRDACLGFGTPPLQNVGTSGWRRSAAAPPPPYVCASACLHMCVCVCACARVRVCECVSTGAGPPEPGSGCRRSGLSASPSRRPWPHRRAWPRPELRVKRAAEARLPVLGAWTRTRASRERGGRCGSVGNAAAVFHSKNSHGSGLDIWRTIVV